MIDGLLDEVENAEGPKALVTRATGKYWSNGLDLDWMMADPERAGPLLAGVDALLARVLVMPCRLSPRSPAAATPLAGSSLSPTTGR